jgi:hypothetical protein
MAAARAVRPMNARAKSDFALPSLPYDLGALEPAVNAEIMTLHHGKHHATYVANLNAAMDKYAEAEAKKDVATMIALQERPPRSRGDPAPAPAPRGLSSAHPPPRSSAPSPPACAARRAPSNSTAAGT